MSSSSDIEKSSAKITSALPCKVPNCLFWLFFHFSYGIITATVSLFFPYAMAISFPAWTSLKTEEKLAFASANCNVFITNNITKSGQLGQVKGEVLFLVSSIKIIGEKCYNYHFSGQKNAFVQYTSMKKKRGKPTRRKSKNIATMRGCLTVITELCGIAGFLLLLYTFLKEFLWAAYYS